MADTKTIAGNGNTTQPGSADQSTVFGSGLAGDPMRTGVFILDTTDSIAPGTLHLGAPLSFFIDSDDHVNFSFGRADTAAHAIINGIRAPNRNGRFALQFAGIVELTTAEWDVVTGQSGGLTPGAAYFVSATAGMLRVGLPASGQIASMVGKALDGTRMQLLLACPGLAVP